MKERSFNLDVIRVFATICVPGIHFFMRTGFYEQPMIGLRSLAGAVVQAVTYCGVPLFMILSGYLKKNKKADVHHYCTIVPVLVSYIVCYAMIVAYKLGFEHLQMSVRQILSDFLNYTNSYAWYIEMYIGLFLLMPLINGGWNALQTKRQKRFVLLTLLVLTIFPYTFNVGEMLGTYPRRLLPGWWEGSYPLAYYCMGAYLRDYGAVIDWRENAVKKQRTAAFFTAAAAAVLTAALYAKQINEGHKWSFRYNQYSALLVFILSVAIFSFLLTFRTQQDWLKKVMSHLASRSLDIYLLSYIADMFWIPRFFPGEGSFPQKAIWMPLFVVTVYLSSLLLAECKELLLRPFSRIYDRLKQRFMQKQYS